MRGALPNTDQPRIPHSEHHHIRRRRQDDPLGVPSQCVVHIMSDIKDAPGCLA